MTWNSVLNLLLMAAYHMEHRFFKLERSMKVDDRSTVG